MTSNRKVSELDLHIGQRLRRIRKLRNLSMEKLAELIGITYQQMQKYESGQNRVSAATLYRFSLILEVDISVFYEGLDGPEITPLPEINRAQLQLISLYNRAPKKLQRDFIKFLEASIGWINNE